MRASFYPSLLLLLTIGATPAVALEADLSLLLQNELRAIADSPINPNNQNFGLPSRLHQAEFRAELRQALGPVDLTARPRAWADVARVNGSDTSGADLFFQEAFLKIQAHENISLSVGRIQFGWGPAESVTPSNWLAPEIQLEPSPYFQQLGYNRAQANITIGQGFSLVAAGELQPLPDHFGTREFPAEVFRKRSFAKAEWNWDNANKVFGVVGGRERRAAGDLWRAGAYGSLTLSDAWQLYFDGAWRESRPGGGGDPFVVAGARYTLEGGAEFHAEGIRNQGAGRNRAGSVSGYGDLTLSELLVNRGTALLNRDYAFLSFGWPNAPIFPSWAQTPVLYLRALHSIGDHSTALLFTTEIGFRDHYTVGLYGAAGFGPNASEMRQIYDGLLGFVGKINF
ncbi:MAG: hypothetical protein EOP11_12955 [Proteobacteria bacterium]|nr:MAG: hypothetical protein EOP11_12955 [Pseudomonadota bacterium]